VSSKPQRWRLPPAHLELLKAVMSDGVTDRAVTLEQRSVLRQICAAPERVAFEPEDFLIAFKLALVDAANEVGIKPGPERNDFLSRLVSVYIEEFYRSPASADGRYARDGGHKRDSAHIAGDQGIAAGSP
jgi:hypothetical protein